MEDSPQGTFWPAGIWSQVNFAVPTGNFGNVFAGHAARRMGVPIELLTVASNANDILTRFFETGRMETQGVVRTHSPSMDIQVSSNFERLLFDVHRSDRLVVCMDPGDLDLLRDFGQDRATTRLLEIECQFSDAELAAHATRIGLAGATTPPGTAA